MRCKITYIYIQTISREISWILLVLRQELKSAKWKTIVGGRKYHSFVTIRNKWTAISTGLFQILFDRHLRQRTFRYSVIRNIITFSDCGWPLCKINSVTDKFQQRICDCAQPRLKIFTKVEDQYSNIYLTNFTMS